MGMRLVRLVLLLTVVGGALAACIVVPAGYPRQGYAYGPPPPPPPCRWVWVGRWECR